MKTCYNKAKGDFDIAWPGKVARHDLVYLSPPTDPMQYGMPIGNGDIGALMWCEEERIVIALNKCDLWDDAAGQSFGTGNREEEEASTTLRHACRIIIDFHMPIFSTLYLKDFSGRLRLQDGCIEMSLECPFGTLRAEMFITYHGNLLCARMTTDFIENDGVDITLERYGSRTFAHWYRYFKRDSRIGLEGTDTWTKDGSLFLSHQLTTGKFICALRPDEAELKYVRRTGHTVSAIGKQCPKEFTFYALCTSPFEPMEEREILSVLEQASRDGFNYLLAENERCWKAFWERSFLETDDEYLDNLWHLAMYYANAGQRGRYPGRFINSLWNWNRDIQPWTYYFHWNQQTVYWGLNAAGHHDLCESYLNYRFQGMEYGKEDAWKRFGVKDALFVSDVCDRRGVNSNSEQHNHTPVGEIAMDFWRQYCYTCDREFLEKKAFPYMLGAARFAVSLLVKEEDGKYHARCGSGYEGSQLLYDPITELAMIRALFPAVLEAMEILEYSKKERKIFSDILQNLAEIRMLDADERMVKKNEAGICEIQLGMFKGRSVPTKKVFALGRAIKENKNARVDALAGKYVPAFVPSDIKVSEKISGCEIVWRMLSEHFIPEGTAQGVERLVHAHPQANISPIFPLSSIGLKDRGSEQFDVAVTTAMTSRNEQFAGFDPMPIALARLGLTEEVDTYIYEYPSCWQYYNNGFGHYGPNAVMLADRLTPFRREYLEDSDTGEKFWAETYPFRHMGLEPLGVFSAVMNERLIQSYDGVIRIAPAYGRRNARFKLHATGGFEVMCEIADGVPSFVAVRSLKGKKLKLENPWECAWCEEAVYEASVIEMDTEAGRIYLFTPEKEWHTEYEEEVPVPNMECRVRTDRKAMLGTERSF